MIQVLLGLGLAITPFICMMGYDTRAPKMAAALVFALSLGLWALYKGQLKAFTNKWVLIFIGYLLVNIYFSPKPDIVMFGLQAHNIWVWHSVSYIIIFTLMLISVSSISFNPPQIKRILNIMVTCGLIMAVYCILQAFNLDQFFKSPDGITKLFSRNSICGTLGNTTVVAPFMAMLIPLALYLKRYWFAGIMAIAVMLTISHIGIGAMVISLLFYFGVKSKRNLIISATIMILIISAYAFPYMRNSIKDSGRFLLWRTAVNSVINPPTSTKYPITGIGTGSFGYLFPAMHAKHAFLGTCVQAHNEYIEIFWNTGLAGLAIFLCAMFAVWKQNFSIKAVLRGTANKYRMALLSSFLCISLCAIGIFAWQIGTLIFYTIIVAGLLTNTSEV